MCSIIKHDLTDHLIFNTFKHAKADYKLSNCNWKQQYLIRCNNYNRIKHLIWLDFYNQFIRVEKFNRVKFKTFIHGWSCHKQQEFYHKSWQNVEKHQTGSWCQCKLIKIWIRCVPFSGNRLRMFSWVESLQMEKIRVHILDNNSQSNCRKSYL